jgi:hypothetical protein
MEWKYAKQVIHQCRKNGWPIARIVRLVPQYTAPEIEKILSQPAPPDEISEVLPARSKKRGPTRQAPEWTDRTCRCGCQKPLIGRQKYASAKCRKKVSRRQRKAQR